MKKKIGIYHLEHEYQYITNNLYKQHHISISKFIFIVKCFLKSYPNIHCSRIKEHAKRLAFVCTYRDISKNNIRQNESKLSQSSHASRYRFSVQYFMPLSQLCNHQAKNFYANLKNLVNITARLFMMKHNSSLIHNRN